MNHHKIVTGPAVQAVNLSTLLMTAPANATVNLVTGVMGGILGPRQEVEEVVQYCPPELDDDDSEGDMTFVGDQTVSVCQDKERNAPSSPTTTATEEQCWDDGEDEEDPAEKDNKLMKALRRASMFT